MAATRLFVDLQTVQNHPMRDRGIPRFATGHARALLRHGGVVEALALNPLLPFPTDLHPELGAAAELSWNTASRWRASIAKGPTAYHIMSPFESLTAARAVLPAHIMSGTAPVVCTVYDLIPEVLDLYRDSPHVQKFMRVRTRVLATADLLLCISESTRSDVLDRLPVDEERVVVIGAAADDRFVPAGPEDRPTETVRTAIPAIMGRFVLAVAGRDRHKNVEALIDAFARLPHDLRSGLQLAIVCQLPLVVEAELSTRCLVQGLQSGRDVVFAGYVPDPVLRAMYQSAELLVCPSLYEGFGLPVLEAARCRCPAITSNTSSLPEVLTFPAATFAPNAEDMAAAIERALTDEPFRCELVAAGDRAVVRHSWSEVARRTVDALGRLEPALRRARPGSSPLRVAVVGTPTSVPAEVLDALGERSVLDRFGTSTAQRGSAARGAYPLSAFGRIFNPSAYDLVLYAVDDRPASVAVRPMALTFPGVVWFATVDLVDLYLAVARAQGTTVADIPVVARGLSRWPPDGGPPYSETTLRAVCAERTVRLTAELASSARACVVASSAAAHALELDAGPFSVLPPIHVVQPARSSDWIAAPAGARSRLVLRGPDARLLDVLRGRPPAEVWACRVVAIAHDPMGAQSALVERGGRPSEPPVEWIGAGDGTSLPTVYRGARCVVELGDPRGDPEWRGLPDALAAGTAVVTDLAAAADLPEGTVVRLPAGAAAGVVVDTVGRLLNDAGQLRTLASGALDWSRRWTPDDVADALLAVHGGLVERRTTVTPDDCAKVHRR